MSAFDLLKEPIKQYIWRQGWRQFFPIQEAAISYILNSGDNFILASRTASGKTEAAFLPAISSVTNWQNGVKILYISPLIALINDQFLRIEKLCEHLDIKITKWHGEASRAAKNSLVKSPEGILLITPESIEAMFVNHPENIKGLFRQLDFVVIDEIHSFIGTARGKHLQSLLSRINRVSESDTRYIGLSATLSKDSYQLAKDFFDSAKEAKVLVSDERNELSVSVFYIPTEQTSLPPELIEDVYHKTQTRKSLIFPNTRGRVEEIAVRLKRQAEKSGGHENYFAHHSSVDRELREFVEHFAKSSSTQNFAISCTSTLELGIDIGSVDTVIQIDSTFSIASLVQRLGRSGRKNHESNLILYATNPWSLLQSIACIDLYKKRFIEPLPSPYSINVLVQQLLSILKETSGIRRDTLLLRIRDNQAFLGIPEEQIDLILDELLQRGVVESLGRELIVGVDGEKITNKLDFYSLFDSENNLKVEYKGKVIGELPLSPQLVSGENIFLGAKIWKIQEVDLKAKKIYVNIAKDGKRPKFFGSGGDIHPVVREKMLELLYTSELPSYQNDSSGTALGELRKKFLPKRLKNLSTERPLFQNGSKSEFYTFTGTRINRTLNLYFSMIDTVDVKYLESESMFESDVNISMLIEQVLAKIPSDKEIEMYLEKDLTTNKEQYKLDKYVDLLPISLQAEYLLRNSYDIAGTNKFIQEITLT